MHYRIEIPVPRFNWILDYFYNTGNPNGDTLLHAAGRFKLGRAFTIFLLKEAIKYKMDVNNISYSFIDHYVKKFPANVVHKKRKFTWQDICCLDNNGLNITKINKLGETVLHCINVKNDQTLEALRDLDFDFKAIDNDGRTVLHNLPLQKDIIDSCAVYKTNVNAIDKNGKNILNGRKYNLDLVQYLVEKHGFKMTTINCSDALINDISEFEKIIKYLYSKDILDIKDIPSVSFNRELIELILTKVTLKELLDIHPNNYSIKQYANSN